MKIISKELVCIFISVLTNLLYQYQTDFCLRKTKQHVTNRTAGSMRWPLWSLFVFAVNTFDVICVRMQWSVKLVFVCTWRWHGCHDNSLVSWKSVNKFWKSTCLPFRMIHSPNTVACRIQMSVEPVLLNINFRRTTVELKSDVFGAETE